MAKQGGRPRVAAPEAGEPREGYTALGVVLRPQGLRGEVRAHAFAAGAPNLQAGRRVSIGEREYRVVAARPDREGWVLQLAAIGDREAAEGLRGKLIEAPDAAVLREDADSYFVHELVGLEVVTRDGDSLGKITEVLQPGANDVYVVAGPRGEVLIPAIGEVVEAIDVGRGVMVITPLPGLLDIPQ